MHQIKVILSDEINTWCHTHFLCETSYFQGNGQDMPRWTLCISVFVKVALLCHAVDAAADSAERNTLKSVTQEVACLLIISLLHFLLVSLMML